MHIDHDHVAGGHMHEHAHEHEHHHGGESHTSMAELLALMKYMIGHNAAHAQELAELARDLTK